MKLKYDKKYWFSICLNILLFVVATFFAGKYYIINRNFVNLQKEYNILSSTFNENSIVNSPNSVQSNDQQGGITAGSISIESPKREINEQFIQELNKYLSEFSEFKDKKIIVKAIMGDSEALQLAEGLKQYFESQDWTVDGVHLVFVVEPLSGIKVKKSPLGITIGSKS